MPYTANAIVNDGFPMGLFTFTYALSGLTRNGDYNVDDKTAQATAGKVVALDTAAQGQVKLAGDGDAIFGRIYTAENRGVLGIFTAAVARKFKERVPTAAGYTSPALGDRLIGGGAGTVKKATANSGAGVPTDPVVIEIGTGYVVAEFM